MCVAIYSPAKLHLTEDVIRSCWQANPDGAGFAFVADSKVVISKGFMKCKEFLEGYNTATKENPHSPFLIHFRIRTMGDKDELNTHPFPIKNGALIHNGSFDGTGAVFKGQSDTAKFAERYYSHPAWNYEDISENKADLEKDIEYNKVAMLWDDSKYLILNESKGTWVGNIWFSNNSYTSSRSSLIVE